MSPRFAARSGVVLTLGLFALLLAGPAAAQPSTDRGGSIVVFPKVIADGSSDTVLQLTNVSNNVVAASCAYVDGARPAWDPTRFGVMIGARWTVTWTAARGRNTTMPPLDVPPAAAGFRGELLCVQVDAGGAPLGGNSLAGQATVHDLATGDVAGYRAVGLRGSGFNDGDDALCIGDGPPDRCLIGEYDACPGEWILSVPAEGAGAPGAPFATDLTVVPCSQDLAAGQPGTVAIAIAVFNELGQQFRTATEVTCWGDLALADLEGGAFSRGTLGSDFAEARLTPASDAGGFLLVAETGRLDGDRRRAAAAIVPQYRGAAAGADLIVFPTSGAVP